MATGMFLAKSNRGSTPKKGVIKLGSSSWGRAWHFFFRKKNLIKTKKKHPKIWVLSRCFLNVSDVSMFHQGQPFTAIARNSLGTLQERHTFAGGSMASLAREGSPYRRPVFCWHPSKKIDLKKNTWSKFGLYRLG